MYIMTACNDNSLLKRAMVVVDAAVSLGYTVSYVEFVDRLAAT